MRILKGREHAPDAPNGESTRASRRRQNRESRCPGCLRHDVKIGSRHKKRGHGADWCDGKPDPLQPKRDAALDALADIHDALTTAYFDGEYDRVLAWAAPTLAKIRGLR